MARKVRVMLMAMRSSGASVLQNVLGPHGYHIEVASHQNDVIEAIDAAGVDIVLITVGWQTRLGEDVLRDLQRRAGRRVRFIYFIGASGAPPLVEPRKGQDQTLPARYTLRMLRTALAAARRRYQPNIQNRGLAA